MFFVPPALLWLGRILSWSVSLRTFALAVAGTLGWHWRMLVFVLTCSVTSCCSTPLQNDRSYDSMHMYGCMLGIVGDPPYAMLLHSLNRFLDQLQHLLSPAGLFVGLPFLLVLAELCLSSASLLLLGFYILQWYCPV